METLSFSLDKPDFFCLKNLVHVHGWVELSPFDFCEESQTLSFAVFVNEIPVDVEIKEVQKKLEINLFSFDVLSRDSLSILKLKIRNMLNLDFKVDPLLKKAVKFGDEYENLVKKGWNRLLKSSSLFEDFSKTLFTTNCSWALTKKISSSLCCEKFSKRTIKGNFPFPEPASLIGFSEDDFKSFTPMGYRTGAFKEIINIFHGNKGVDLKKLTSLEAHEFITSIKGFGDYCACHIMVLNDFYDRIPTDSVVANYMKKYHGVEKKELKKFIEKHYKEWGDHLWWGFRLESVLFSLRYD